MELINAIKNNDDIEFIKKLIENSPDINKKNHVGNTALTTASDKGDEDIVKILIENDADVNVKRKDGNTALILAVNSGNVNIVKILIENDADVNAKRGDEDTALIRAVNIGNENIVKILIENGAEVNAKDKEGRTTLIVAVFFGNENCVKILIENSADVNAKDKDEHTALIHAVFVGSENSVNMLIENGADVNAKNKDGKTALIVATIYNNEKIAKLLIDKGADVDTEDKDGFSAIDYAHDSSNFRAFFFEQGHKSNNFIGNEEKISNIIKEEKESLEIIKKYSVDEFLEVIKRFNPKSFLVKSSMSNHIFTNIASGGKLEDLDKLFMEMGTDQINEKNHKGLTPIMAACKEGDAEKVKRLIELGADIKLKDREDKTAWDYADNSKNKDEILEVLRKKDDIINSNSHKPKSLVEILSNFTKDTPIKYTTHLWDFGSIKSEYGSFNGFLDSVKEQLDKTKEQLQELSPDLYKKIYSFILETEQKESWTTKADIKIGWSSLEGLEEWCDNGGNPFEFKLKTPIEVEKKKLRTFKDVIELFKKEIEIRNENNMLEKLFFKQQRKLGIKFTVELKKLKGRGFYTDVEKFENVLSRVFDAIKSRDEHNKVTVEVVEPDNECIEIRIVHHDSFSHKSKEDLLAEADDGDFKILKESLTHLCDWSIESTYDSQGFRINYLKKTNTQEIEEINTPPCGFTYTFRFYKK